MYQRAQSYYRGMKAHINLREELKINKVKNEVETMVQGRSQDFSKGGSQTGTPSGDRRLYMVYTAALPRVSAGSVVLSRHEGPNLSKDKSR